jgi:hypothetical protein
MEKKKTKYVRVLVAGGFYVYKFRLLVKVPAMKLNQFWLSDRLFKEEGKFEENSAARTSYKYTSTIFV